MAKTAFEFQYEGPALADGTMAVRDLAPALLALGEMFTEASRQVYPDREPVALNIKATHEGSFLVDLLLQTDDAWDQLIDLFGSDATTALLNLKDVVIGGAGVIWLIKRVGRSRVTASENTPEPGHVRLTLDDETTVEVATEVVALYQNIEVRKRAREVVAPLTREGIDELRLIENETVVTVCKEDVPAFDLPADAETLLDTEQEMILGITTLSFQEGNRWRLSDGQRVLSVAIDDDDFRERVTSGAEAFRNGDMLRCRIRLTQTRRRQSLHTDYRVVSVIEHIPRPTQLSLEPDDPAE